MNCVEFMPDGKSIVTGWSDGQVRAFTPQKGKLLYSIADAHIAKPFAGSPLKQNSAVQKRAISQLAQIDDS